MRIQIYDLPMCHDGWLGSCALSTYKSANVQSRTTDLCFSFELFLHVHSGRNRRKIALLDEKISKVLNTIQGCKSSRFFRRAQVFHTASTIDICHLRYTHSSFSRAGHTDFLTCAPFLSSFL